MLAARSLAARSLPRPLHHLLRAGPLPPLPPPARLLSSRRRKGRPWLSHAGLSPAKLSPADRSPNAAPASPSPASPPPASLPPARARRAPRPRSSPPLRPWPARRIAKARRAAPDAFARRLNELGQANDWRGLLEAIELGAAGKAGGCTAGGYTHRHTATALKQLARMPPGSVEEAKENPNFGPLLAQGAKAVADPATPPESVGRICAALQALGCKIPLDLLPHSQALLADPEALSQALSYLAYQAPPLSPDAPAPDLFHRLALSPGSLLVPGAPADVARALAAHAELRVPCPRLARGIGKNAASLIGGGAPSATASLARSLSLLPHPPAAFFRAADAAGERLAAAGEAKHVAALLRSFARLGLPAPALLAATERHAARLVRRAREPDYAELCAALAEHGDRGSGVFGEALARAGWLVRRGGAAKVCEAAAELGHDAGPLLDEVDAAGGAGGWSAGELAGLARALGEAPPRGAGALRGALGEPGRFLGEATGGQACDVAWAIAVQGGLEEGGGGLVMKLWEKAGEEPEVEGEPEEELEEELEEEPEEEAPPEPEPDEAWRVGKSKEYLEYFDQRKRLRELLDEAKFELAKAEERAQREKRAPATGEASPSPSPAPENSLTCVQLLRLHQVRVHAASCGLELPPLPAGTEARVREAAAAHRRKGGMDEQLSAYLTKLGFRHERNARPLGPEAGAFYAVDAADPGGKIAVESLGPGAFLRAPLGRLGAGRERGETAAKRRLLERAGWAVVELPWRERARAENGGKKVYGAWLVEKLKKAGWERPPRPST
ncbi:hypothetical protein TeGR_g2882 [Tetraparma gracilis]|uniref:RAP domain-containing protein n=1 Tax=Tetraparma gracilis TaxID=2962635 RepID=A0ABQ6MF80_9STRA|nr:hypothetical protein TeGR_g2882 [Tetraparma gracilis]